MTPIPFTTDPPPPEAATSAPAAVKNKPRTQAFHVWFNEEEMAQVRRLAQANGLAVSAWIRQATLAAARKQG